MSKILTSDEVATIVSDLLTKPEVLGELEDGTLFESFLEDVAKIVAGYCGGQVVATSPPEFTVAEAEASDYQDYTKDQVSYCVHVRGNCCLPDREKNIWTFHGFDPDGELYPEEEDTQ